MQTQQIEKKFKLRSNSIIYSRKPIPSFIFREHYLLKNINLLYQIYLLFIIDINLIFSLYAQVLHLWFESLCSAEKSIEKFYSPHAILASPGSEIYRKYPFRLSSILLMVSWLLQVVKYTGRKHSGSSSILFMVSWLLQVVKYTRIHPGSSSILMVSWLLQVVKYIGRIHPGSSSILHMVSWLLQVVKYTNRIHPGSSSIILMIFWLLLVEKHMYE